MSRLSRWLRRSAIPLAVLVAVVGAIVAALPRAGSISEAIGQAVRTGNGQPVDLARLTPFTWSELQVFQPYTPRRQVCAAAGLSRERCAELVAERGGDGILLLVFRNGS